MLRVRSFIRETYGLEQNPFPAVAIAQWGSNDVRENGMLFNTDVIPQEYEEAVEKFIIGPIDSGSKFHFLWSLGEGEEARGFGKTVLLQHLSREINRDLGMRLLMEHDFDEAEARETPILATMGTFNKTDVTSLSAVCLEQVEYLAQSDPITGRSPIMALREHMVRSLQDQGRLEGVDRVYAEAEAIRNSVREADLALKGKTLGSPDRRLVEFLETADWEGLLAFLRGADPKKGFELLSSCFVVARAAGVRAIILFIDQVEDFANSDTPKKRRSTEVERFRDIAIETQPFGQMASYVLTMHPAAARSIEEFWSLARLPKIDHLMKQNQRITVILRPLRQVENAEKLLLGYLKRFRRSDAGVEPLHPFDRDTLTVLMEHCSGRPGPMLKMAHDLIEEGARNHWPRIGESEARELADEESVSEEVLKPAYRRRIGAVG